MRLPVAFIKLPELAVQPMQQRYTRLASNDASAAPDAISAVARYRYEGLESGYTTELPVDEAGLVVEYPAWFRRVYP